MIPLINKYLFSHKSISFADLGTIRIQERSAELDFHNKLLHGPSHEILFSSEVTGSELFINWLMNQYQMESEKAVSMLTEFMHDFQKTIQSQGTFVWQGLGTFQELTAGNLKFIPEPVAKLYPDIEIERVIHKDADHVLTVGERERTKFEMEAWFSDSNKKIKSKWWIAAIILVSASVGLLLSYYLMQPSLFHKQGNHQTIKVLDMPLLHEDIN
ncbi:MAG: hypothetical protein ACOVP6_01035 [Lacibacter sp.]